MYEDIPNIWVDTTIDVNSMLYHDLNFPTGWGYTPNGYKGLFIFCVALGEYVVFERCCTYDPRIEEARVFYDPNKQILIDSVCGSQFSPWNGMPINGSPAEIPLRPYQAQYYEVSQRLRITNY